RYLSEEVGDFSLRCLQRAVQLQPNFIDAHYYLGLWYLSRGNFRNALQAFNQYLFFDCRTDRAVQVKQLMALMSLRM
ncbi:MAG: hypothetical protein ACPLRA_00805, partial [Candidatus Saccharicenans sp.]